MENNEESKKFTAELERRFQELEQWALQNWPDKSHPLATSDFSELRSEIARLGKPNDPNKREPEPSEGGAQYISLNPTPWP